MELEELEVPQLGAHLVRQGPAVARGRERVGGDGVELSHAAGGEDDGWTGQRQRLSTGPDRHDSHHALPPPRHEHSCDLGVLADLDERMAGDDLGETPDEHRAGAVAAGVEDPRAAMRPFEAHPQRSVRPSVEHRTQGDQLADSLRSLRGEDAHRLGIGEPVARRERVGGVECRTVSGAEGRGDPTLRPRARAVGERALGDENRRASRQRQAPRAPHPSEARADDDEAAGVRRTQDAVTKLRTLHEG